MKKHKKKEKHSEGKERKEEGKNVERKSDGGTVSFNFDYKKGVAFVKKYHLFLLILIPIFISIIFRMQPAHLPQTDDWATNVIHNNIRQGVNVEIDKRYPHLPDAQKQELINRQFSEILTTQSAVIEQQIAATSQGLKARLQDENGQTYLLAIDPWLWYGLANQYVKNGYFGDGIDEEGRPTYSLRGGRFGSVSGFSMVAYIEAKSYQILNFLGFDISLLSVAFFYPLVIMSLAAIPAFLIGRKVGGSLGGLIAATLVVVHPALIGRTISGFSDTDPLNAFFPILISWLFLETIDAKTTRAKSIYGALTGIGVGLFAISWQGYWFVVNFIVVTLILYLAYLAVMKIVEKGEIKSIVPVLKKEGVVALGIILSTVIFAGVFGWLTRGGNIFGLMVEYMALPAKNTLWFIEFKQVAVTTLWPNVLTTVAELNPTTTLNVIKNLGGLFMFIIALAGIGFCFFEKSKEGKRYVHYGFLLAIWLAATMYASKSSLRFIALVVPGFSIAIGIGIGAACKHISTWCSKELHINKQLITGVFVLVGLLVLLSPMKIGFAGAQQVAPSMDDAWYDSLTAIKHDTEQGIITSWWDFGHWFVAVAERTVTFDGGDQGQRIHWVGKSLLVPDEKASVGILKMLNCGQNEAYHALNKYNEEDTIETVDILNEIVLLDKNKAKSKLKEEGLNEEQSEEVLALTHCEPWDQYYITSEDMISKAGVWGHFGSWDFTKAEMWQKARSMSQQEGIDFLQKEYGLSVELATQYYYEIQGTEADRWISPWPGYVGGRSGCQTTEEQVICDNSLVVDLTTMEATVGQGDKKLSPHSLVYVAGKDVKEKKFGSDGTQTYPLSVALIPQGEGYYSRMMDPLHANSVFTNLFLFDGHGSRYFDVLSDQTTLSGQRIIVYKVDWEGKTKHVAYGEE